MLIFYVRCLELNANTEKINIDVENVMVANTEERNMGVKNVMVANMDE